ncbi:MAG: hypothetical protein DSZ07_00290, partial [Sulfurovum sp.]
MFNKLKNLFINSHKETIDIFEKQTKIKYEEDIFTSFKVLSLTNSSLKNLNPLSVFINLEIINLSSNRIDDITVLENFRKAKIIDLRFNNIQELPKWFLKQNRPIYWERDNDEKEGIFLEGNPIDKSIIENIRKTKIESIVLEPLSPLNTQHLAIFIKDGLSSMFLDYFTQNRDLIVDNSSNFRLNISQIEYLENSIENTPLLHKIEYILLILQDTECCLYPPILENIIEYYPNSKIFLIIENQNENIKEKINFFKTYNRSNSIINVFHSKNRESNKIIYEYIYKYLQNSKEAKSLWKESWLELKNDIENQNYRDFSFEEFQ